MPDQPRKLSEIMIRCGSPPWHDPSQRTRSMRRWRRRWHRVRPRKKERHRGCAAEDLTFPAIADPDIAEPERRLAWMDDEFDAEAFNLDAVNQKLAKVR
jgi:hypothetical protein